MNEEHLVPMPQPSIARWKEIWKERLQEASSEATKELCRVALKELKKYEDKQEA